MIPSKEEAKVDLDDFTRTCVEYVGKNHQEKIKGNKGKPKGKGEGKLIPSTTEEIMKQIQALTNAYCRGHFQARSRTLYSRRVGPYFPRAACFSQNMGIPFWQNRVFFDWYG